MRTSPQALILPASQDEGTFARREGLAIQPEGCSPPPPPKGIVYDPVTELVVWRVSSKLSAPVEERIREGAG